MSRNDELKIVIRAQDFATGELAKINGALSAFVGRVKSGYNTLREHWVGAAAAYYATMKTISGVWSLFEKAAGREDQIEALDRLVAKYNTSANEIVAAIKTSSHGLVDTKTALDSIGDAVMRNLDPRILEKFAAGAVVMAKATGESTATAYGEIIEAVATGQQRALKRITGVMDMKEKYGEGFASFSEGQQAALRMKLVLEKLTERLREYGEVTDGTDDKIVRFKNIIAELKATVGTGLNNLFGGSFGDFAKGIDDAVKSLKTFVSENDRFLGAVGGVGQSIGESIANVARTIGIIAKDMGVWQILWTAFTAGLKVANLSIALFADFIAYIKIGLYALGWLLDKLIIAPLRLFASWGADLAERFGFDKAAKGLREFIALSQAGADQVEADLKRMTVDEDPINKNWNRAVEKNKALLKIQQEGVKAAQEAKKAATTFTPSSESGFSAAQKKAVEDFLSWYKTQSAKVTGEIKALHGDEAGALKEQYEKSMEEIAQKARELKKENLLVEKDGAFTIDPMLNQEGRAKAAEALKAYNDLKEKYTTLFHDKEILLQAQTDARIAEMSLYDYEAIHKTKLALLEKQLNANPALLQAAIANENLLYAGANRERVNEARKMHEDMASLWLEGSQKTIADLKSSYQDDLAAFREKVYQKKATWEEYDTYVRAREHRLQEELKKIQGTSTDGMKDAVRDYIDESSNEYNRGRDFFNKSVGGMESAIGDFLYAASQGTFKVKDMFQSMGLSILKAASEIIAKMIMLRIVSGLGSFFTPASSAAGAQGSFGPAGGGAPVTAVAAMGGIFQGGFQPAYAFPGGSMPFRAFSSGGIVRRPTVGLVGEGGQNEAVVPLPDGKAIPVKMQGGDGGAPTVNNNWTILAMDTQSMDVWLASKKSTIEGMMADSLARAGLVRDATRRYR
ncbi:MAG: phage tail tape measure C-terminal domain-containing protein [bacterium]|nr:phage tail tape measure C-terminal domain-containing protein [bacterium]